MDQPGGRIQEVLAAYNSGNLDAVTEALAPDVVWHVGGTHALSGDYHGRDGVRGYYDRVRGLTGGSLRLEPLKVLANDRHAGIFLRVTGQHDGKTIDTTMAEAITFDDDGRWAEYWALADDQRSIDEFWGAQVS